MERCVYLRQETGSQTPDNRQIHQCDIHKNCTMFGIANPVASCEGCPDKLLLSDNEFARKFRDPLKVLDRRRERTNALRDMLAGHPSFLVCGGPSAKALDLKLLEQKGIWSIAVNNMAGKYHPNAFVCADPPSKFHHGIWLDPSIMKFVPIPKLSGRRIRLKQKIGEEFVPLKIDGKDVGTPECPNVWGFSRRAWLQTDESFFNHEDAAWGNHDAGCRRTGLEKTVMTMLLAMRILYYLGSRRIYLVGVDFWMNPNAGLKDNYAFPQDREIGAIQSNNRQFGVVNKWLCDMQKSGVFKKFGLEVYNCFQKSGLRAFGYVPFQDAVADALKNFPSSPFDLEGWYEKK